MSVEHIDIVHEQLPELFATKELPENWAQLAIDLRERTLAAFLPRRDVSPEQVLS